MKIQTSFAAIIFVSFLLTLTVINGNSQAQTQFRLTFSEQLTSNTVTGRAIILLSSDTAVDPDIPNPYKPFITFGMDFKNWKPGEELMITEEKTDSFMAKMKELHGYYSLRAVIDTDTSSSILSRNGVLYSDKIICNVGADRSNTIDVPVKNMIRGKGFKESRYIRQLKVESRLLSDFYHVPTYIEAAVVLPESYDSLTEKIYPVVFVMPGFGSTHEAITKGSFQQKRYGMIGLGEEKIYVFLNQDCRYGFHVFANSDNNGPRATSFITELIPYLEKNYRVKKDANSRFLVGQSSGGWAALWLMVNYPDTFGMAWAGSPDPVDFREFLNHNLYDPDANLFFDKNGNLTPAIRHQGVSFTNKEWSEMECATGEGGQYQSFEAVFGRKGTNNRPEHFYDRKTGRINPDAIENWKKYDISMLINENAATLKEKLRNKINIVVSANDDYYLDGSVISLKNTLDSLKIDSNILILEDGGHNTWNDDLREQMQKRMDKIAFPD